MKSPRPSIKLLRERIGCWVHERAKAELALLPWRSGAWLDLCNRNESLSVDNVSSGRICNWNDSSNLTVSRIFPAVGSRLLRHCLSLWPVRFRETMADPSTSPPEASVIVAVGGADRKEQFKLVIKSLLGQSCSSVEIIVVEQSPSPEFDKLLPKCVRYIYDPIETGSGFNKSRALNIAADNACGTFLMVHDADYVVPLNYVEQCCHMLQIVDAVRPSRFNFHIDQLSTIEIISGARSFFAANVQCIVQNNPTPTAIRRKAYWDLGGHDERFVGWGGEDVEFLSRLRTARMSEGGWLPIFHLWHPAAPKKINGDRNQRFQNERLKIPPENRIAELVGRNPDRTIRGCVDVEPNGKVD